MKNLDASHNRDLRAHLLQTKVAKVDAVEFEVVAQIGARPMLRAFLWLCVAAGLVFGGVLAVGGKLT